MSLAGTTVQSNAKTNVCMAPVTAGTCMLDNRVGKCTPHPRSSPRWATRECSLPTDGIVGVTCVYIAACADGLRNRRFPRLAQVMFRIRGTMSIGYNHGRRRDPKRACKAVHSLQSSGCYSQTPTQPRRSTVEARRRSVGMLVRRPSQSVDD